MALKLNAMVLNAHQFEPGWCDRGSGAHYNVQAWTPFPSIGYHAFGDLVQSSGGDWLYGSKATGTVVVLQDVSTDGDEALRPMTNATLQWSDRNLDVGIWSLSAPGGFVAIGTVVGNPITKPSNYATINQRLVLPGQIGPEIWDTSGARVSTDVSLWQVTVSPQDPQGIVIGQFVAFTGLLPQQQQVFTLNPEYITWVQNPA